MTLLRYSSSAYEKYTLKWFSRYFVILILATIFIVNLKIITYDKASANTYGLIVVIPALVIGLVKAINLQKVAADGYLAARINETRRGIYIYATNTLNKPIYVPLRYLKVEPAVEGDSKYLIQFDQAFIFNNGQTSLYGKGKLYWDTQLFKKTELIDFLTTLKNLIDHPGSDLGDDLPNVLSKDYSQTTNPFIKKKYLAGAAWAISLISVGLVFVAANSNLTLATPKAKTSVNASKKQNYKDYHSKYNYSKGMTIKTEKYQFTINHIYRAKSIEEDDLLILNLNAENIGSADETSFISDDNFKSFGFWSLKGEKDGDELPATTKYGKSAKVFVNGKVKQVVNMLGDGWYDNNFDSDSFNVVVEAADEATEVLYQGYYPDEGKGEDDDTSFVLTVKKNDLEDLS